MKTGQLIVCQGMVCLVLLSGVSRLDAVTFLPLGGLMANDIDSFALGVSNDGSTVVGESQSSFGPEAFRWTSATGMLGLGILPGGTLSRAKAVSSNGSIVVGESASASTHFGEAFRWSDMDGMLALGDGRPSRSDSVLS